jgi:disulfide bond formation protein DsbB
MSNVMVRNINALGVAGIAFILAMGLAMQIVLHELPCPLCLLQRVGFALVMYGFMLNVLNGVRFQHYGIIMLGALFGAAVALRQVLLHVVPGTGTYGSAVFGLHLYSWAFVLFGATLFAAGVLLLLSRSADAEVPVKTNTFERFICWAAIAIAALNVVATLLECGPLVCADNPTDYLLL